MANLKLKQKSDAGSKKTANGANGTVVHAHRTAKVIEIVCSSNKSFVDAVQHGIKDASATTRGITGGQVQQMSVKCKDGKVTEYRVSLKIAFGVESTPSL